MSIICSALNGATISAAPTDDPPMAIALALEDVEDASRRYRLGNSPEDGIALLNAIEDLRRFVLVRRTLARPGRDGGAPLGRQLCAALSHMIGDVPRLVEASLRPREAAMERDMRRAIACLFFLGSMDPAFL